MASVSVALHQHKAVKLRKVQQPKFEADQAQNYQVQNDQAQANRPHLQCPEGSASLCGGPISMQL